MYNENKGNAEKETVVVKETVVAKEIVAEKVSGKKKRPYRHPRHLTWQEEEGYFDDEEE
jgi:hypothetical protein